MTLYYIRPTDSDLLPWTAEHTTIEDVYDKYAPHDCLYIQPVKVLIACPLGGKKQYSINTWLNWIANQTFPNYEVALCINGEALDELVEKMRQVSWRDIHGQEKKPVIMYQEDKVILTQSKRMVFARESIRQYAVKDKSFTHILWLDSDTIPLLRDAIPRLLSHGKSFVSGVYFYKGSAVPVMVDRDTGTNFTVDKLAALHTAKQLGNAVITGFGICLNDRAVFESCEFNFDRFGTEVGDDYGWCYQCENLHIPRFLDPVVVANHMGKPHHLLEDNVITADMPTDLNTLFPQKQVDNGKVQRATQRSDQGVDKTVQANVHDGRHQ